MLPKEPDVLYRVVEVLCAAGARGSGYGVNADLVLTAAHVVGDDTEVLIVADGEDLRGDVVWRDAWLDAALVRLPAPQWEAEATLWASVAGVHAVSCTAIGYPKVQRTTDGTRVEEHIAGFIMPATGRRIRRYAINVTTALPYELRRVDSPWAGMSGAAVLSGDGRHILAVITEDPTGFQPSRLEAVPVSELLRDPSFAELVGAGPAAMSTVDAAAPEVVADVHPRRPKGSPSSASSLSTSSAEAIDYDVRQDGLFALGTWSPARKLEPSLLVTDNVPSKDRPAQPYIDHETLAASVRERSRKSSGATVYLTGFRIDHRESDETQYCRIRQASSTYPEVLAIEDLRAGHPALFEECDKAIERNVRDYLTKAVPSSLAMNLVVVSSANEELLCAERSAATDSAVGWWTIGVFETMKQPDKNRPGAPEDIYGLAMRGLREELGLEPHDYHPIQISWIGIFRPILRAHVVAVVKLKIPKAELHSRAGVAHSGYEHAALDWVPLRRSLVQTFVRASRSFPPNTAGTTIEINNRTWTDQSRLAVLEAWRFRNVLDS
ncbi:serine protease [Actinoplanes sp. NPDC051513]|uniref:serine protease n=1 Tax=Actinoplanes sp. NPDC051513 TaxID=3363908 RepID=UPI0037B5A775